MDKTIQQSTPREAKGLQARYRDVLKRLHTCSPCEKAGLKKLLDYYYYKGGAK